MRELTVDATLMATTMQMGGIDPYTIAIARSMTPGAKLALCDRMLDITSMETVNAFSDLIGGPVYIDPIMDGYYDN